jgi:hypothetical protein
LHHDCGQYQHGAYHVFDRWLLKESPDNYSVASSGVIGIAAVRKAGWPCVVDSSTTDRNFNDSARHPSAEKEA